MTPEVLKLMKRRITPESRLPPMEFLFQMFGVECFPRGELVAVTGKAKSGKTFFLSLLMAAGLTRKVLALERFGHTDSTDSTERLRVGGGHTDSTDSTDRASPSSTDNGKICEISEICVTKTTPLRVMWYDTEQSEQSTQDILMNRILPLVRGHTDSTDDTDKLRSGEGHTDSTDGTDGATPNYEGKEKICDICDICVTKNDFCVTKDDFCVTENLIAFNTRGIGWEERRRLFAAGVAYLQPDLVIIDGVRDLISDINDGVEAQQVTEQLMALAQQHRCCIVCVLHQNKGDGDRNLRGWIGTELTNKVFEVYSCEKLRSSHTFKVEQTHTRRHEIGRELYYTVDAETGLPTACDKPIEQPRDAQGRWVSTKAVGNDGRLSVGCSQNSEAKTPMSVADLRRLFTEAMGGRSSRPFNETMAVAMRLGQLTEKRQYYDLLREAEQIGIVRKETATDSGQQYVVLCDNELPF